MPEGKKHQIVTLMQDHTESDYDFYRRAECVADAYSSSGWTVVSINCCTTPNLKLFATIGFSKGI